MIEIDPNIRVAHNHTFVYLDDTTGLKAGDAHVVWQPEMAMAWPASIVEIRGDYVEFDVAWDKWRTVQSAG